MLAFTSSAQAKTFKIATLASAGSTWMKEMRKVSTRLDTINRKDNIEASAALRNQGISVATPAENESRALQVTTASAIDSMIEKGLIDKSLVDEINSLLENYRGRHPADQFTSRSAQR